VSYENPDVPHDVNVARQDPLHEFLRLAAGLVACVAVLGALLYLAGERLARVVPFALEQRWVGDRVLGLDLMAAPSAPTHAVSAREIEPYLQRLADGLAATMRLPTGMAIRVHFADTATPNAFATLGGHVVVTRGLYGRMASENALAMVLAHEIGHVQHRDPIAALGGGASLALLLAVAGGGVESLAPQVAGLVQRGYSRDAERLADEAALGALERFYGHAGGASAVFRELGAARAGAPRNPTLVSTHPTDAERIARLDAAAAGWDPAVQPLRPLAFPLRPTTAP
jgi:Zn-dependent protease with chaperone function